jgi:hypothetical protein
LNNTKISLILIVSLLFLSTFFITINPAESQMDETGIKLKEADYTMQQTFVAVLSAERAGANITNILNRLNYVTNTLSKYSNAYHYGGQAVTTDNIDSLISVANNINTDAVSAQLNASLARQAIEFQTLAFSTVGGVILVIFLFISWRWIKRNHLKQILDKRPVA